MAIVNPPVAALAKLPSDSPAFKRNLIEIINQLWARTGGGADLISAAAVAESYPWDLFGSESNDSTSMYPAAIAETVPQYQAVSISADYTALSFEFINAARACAITLPEYPASNDVIIVRNSDGSKIKLLGNGRKINGSYSGVLRKQGTAIEFYYFASENEWFSK